MTTPTTPSDTPESVAARLENRAIFSREMEGTPRSAELDEEAAALIRAQAAEIARLSTQHEGLKKWYAARLFKCIEAEDALAAERAQGQAMREALTEMVDAMVRYEMAADSDAPQMHRDMMHRARAALSTGATTPQAGEGGGQS